MKNVFLYNHGGSGNHGCEALVRTASQVIRNTVREQNGGTGHFRLDLYSEAPREDIRYRIGKEAGVDTIVPAMQPVRKGSPEYLKAYWDLKVRHDYFTMDLLPYLDMIRQMPRDAVGISIGGDNYCYSFYPKFIRMHQKVAGKCATVLLGCSLEREFFKDRELVKDLRSYELISARESLTYAMLQEAGLTNAIQAPDSAFLLEPEYMPLPEGFQEENTVGLNVSPLIVRMESSPGIILDNYRELIRFILKETDSSIALIPHVVQKGNDDRTVLRMLFEEFSKSGRIVMIPDCDCRKLKGFIARCRFMVAARTHASIAACSTGVPVLSAGYSTKAKGLARDIFGNENRQVVDIHHLQSKDQLRNAFTAMMDQEEESRRHLNLFMPSYVKKMEVLKKRLGAIIRGDYGRE